MYYAIEGKCDIEEFAKILQISSNYEYGMNRFFGSADCDYDEKEESHIYDKMPYLFYKKDKDKIIFDETKIDYLYEMIKNARPQNLLDFHSSRIDFFLGHVINKDANTGKELLNIISQTPNMHIEEHKQYPNLLTSVIQVFANLSYERDISQIYQLFKENKDFYSLIKKNVIKLNMDGKYKTNLAVYKMLSQNEEDYFNICMERVKELKITLQSVVYRDLVEDILYSIKDSVQKKPFKMNIAEIGIQQNYFDNMPYLMALEGIIKSGHYDLIEGNNDKLKEYLQSNQEKINKLNSNDSDSAGISYDEYCTIKRIDYKTIEAFLQFQHLNEKFKIKDKKISNKKI